MKEKLKRNKGMGIKIKCQRCKYIWETKTKKLNVTCPNCLTKVSVEANKV